MFACDGKVLDTGVDGPLSPISVYSWYPEESC